MQMLEQLSKSLMSPESSEWRLRIQRQCTVPLPGGKHRGGLPVSLPAFELLAGSCGMLDLTGTSLVPNLASPSSKPGGLCPLALERHTKTKETHQVMLQGASRPCFYLRMEAPENQSWNHSKRKQERKKPWMGRCYCTMAGCICHFLTRPGMGAGQEQEDLTFLICPLNSQLICSNYFPTSFLCPEKNIFLC